VAEWLSHSAISKGSNADADERMVVYGWNYWYIFTFMSVSLCLVSINQSTISRGFIQRINAKPLMRWYASKRRKKSLQITSERAG